MRRILHADLDAFFASVEQRDNPHLRGKPIAVGSDTARGVVATASYEARKYGVGSAMPSRMARERCPHLTFVTPRFDTYREVGNQVRDVFHQYTDLVEPVSIDEAYLDVTLPKRGPKSGTLIAKIIKNEVHERTGLTLSVGVSYCKFLAKLASDWEKPDGLTTITPDDAPRFLEKLPVEKLHGVGPRTTEKMHALGIRTVADLKRRSEPHLVEQFGKLGRHYHQLAHGIDDRPVDPTTVRKSASSETTFRHDLHTPCELEEHLPPLAEDVARRLEKHDTMGRGVVVKIKYADHTIHTRQVLLPLPIKTAPHILDAAKYVLHHKIRLEQPVRLLGVGVYELADGKLVQPPLFPDWTPVPYRTRR